jgi:hydrogenase expression/formation protein HypD
MKYLDAFRDPAIAAPLQSRLRLLGDALAGRPGGVKIMEVCGGHTMSIARYGIRQLLPPHMSLISGPGCPVCVTAPGYVDTAIKLARNGVTIASFGDMLQVPGSSESLGECRSEGARVEVCYSPRTALELAKADPSHEVVFLAIGFETTIAPVVSLVDLAIREDVKNVSLLTSFKLVSPALRAVLDDPELKIDAFLCPGHVSTVTGSHIYEPFAHDHGKPCVIAGFEPLDILFSLCAILAQLAENRAVVENLYSRAVREDGNPLARKVIERFLQPAGVHWRGMGLLPDSGLVLRDEFAQYDAAKRFGVTIGPGLEHPGCMCGDVIKGKRIPTQCPLFAGRCTPMDPVGPCMVSAEGSCAAYYKYERRKQP